VSVLDRKLLRELRASWLLLTAIVSIIAVGVACYVSMGGAYHNLTEAKRRYYRQCRMADFWIDLKKVPLAELDALAELPGVAAICPRIGFYATVDLEHVTKPLNGMVLSLPDRREAVINDVVIERGGYFTDRRENEVIVNEAFAAHHKLKPGDWIRLVLNNRRQELFIVGTAISSEFVYLLGPGAITPDPEHFGVFYLKQTYAEDVFDFDGAANQVVGRLASDVQQNPHELLDRAERLLSSYGVFTTTPLCRPGVEQVSQRGDSGPAEFRLLPARHLPGRGGDGAQRVLAPAGRTAADGRGHAQRAGLLRPTDLRSLREVWIDRGPSRRTARLCARLLVRRSHDHHVPPVLRVPRTEQSALPGPPVDGTVNKPDLRGLGEPPRDPGGAAPEAGRGNAPQAAEARWGHSRGTGNLALGAAQFRLADGVAGRGPQPGEDTGRRLRRFDGCQCAGHRIHAGRGVQVPG